MTELDPLQKLLSTVWRMATRNKRREEWEAGARPECRLHPGVVVERATYISSGRLLCRPCIKFRRKMSRQLGAVTGKKEPEWARDIRVGDYTTDGSVIWRCTGKGKA